MRQNALAGQTAKQATYGYGAIPSYRRRSFQQVHVTCGLGFRSWKVLSQVIRVLSCTEEEDLTSQAALLATYDAPAAS